MDQVEICNTALVRIGASTISSISQETPSAERCNVLWEPLRDELLSMHYWSFATKAAELSLTGSDPVLSTYNYEYQLSADCLVVQDIFKEEPFDRLENKIHCNRSDDCFAIYTFQQTNPEMFPATFASALAYRLAFDLAIPSANPKLGLNIRDAMWDGFQITIDKAMEIDAVEIGETIETISQWIEARRQGVDQIAPANIYS